MRDIVSIAAREVFGSDLSSEQDRAVTQLLRGVPHHGGSASRTSYEMLVRTAFEAGVVASMMAMREKSMEPFRATIADCHATVERICGKEPFVTVPLDKL